jgi:hypothetical protein
MTVRVFRSTDTDAPALSNGAGSLLAVLDAVLVDGYGSTSALGWTRPFTPVGDICVYRSNIGHQRYLRLNDTANLSTLASVYETMSDLSTGTGEMSAANSYINKTPYDSYTAANWILVSNGKLVYFYTNDNYGFIFGDFPSTVPGDMYNTVLIADTAELAGGLSYFAGAVVGAMPYRFGDLLAGHYVARSYTQLGGAVQISKTQAQQFDVYTASLSYFPLGSLSQYGFGMAADDSVRYSQVQLYESNTILRGYLPGLWAPLYSQADSSVVAGDTHVGTTGSDLDGKTLEAVQWGDTAGLQFIETSNTWPTY